MTEVAEQAEVPPALVEVARKVVVVLSATLTVIPGEANVAWEPVATGEPVQVALV